MNSEQMLFGIGGWATSGKDTLADLLVEHAGFHKTYMSKPLEKALLTLDPYIPTDDPSALPVERYSELHQRVGYDKSKQVPEVRYLLQVLGTEVGREMFGEDCWVNIVMAEASLWMREASTPVAITGIRYKNELLALRNLGGIGVWVSRPGCGPVNSHSSDNSLGPEDFDITVTNDGSIEDLKQKALELVVRYSDLTMTDFDPVA